MSEQKQQLLQHLKTLAQGGPLCVAFSGGVDSAVVLKAACEAVETVHAVTFVTTLHPTSDLPVAKRLAEQCGARHHVVEIDEFADARIMENPPERCYYCKHLLFSTLCRYAEAQKLGTVLDGTNADDLLVYRPGLRALRELAIASPLMQLGFSKAQVRELAAEMGLEVAQRPSAPCLATRLPYGTHITRELLSRIEAGEELCKQLGFEVVRLRLHGDILRIEVPKDRFSDLLRQAETLIPQLKELGFLYITVDLEGFRSGSMDLKIGG